MSSAWKGDSWQPARLAEDLLLRDRWERVALGVLAAVFSRLADRWRRRQRTASQQPMPSTFIAPARAEPWHHQIPAARFHAHCHRVAIGTAITFGQNEKEDDS